MADTKTRIGIIGVGQIGKQHLNNYQTIPNVEIEAIADIDKAEARRAGELHKVPDVYFTAEEVREESKSTAVKMV